ncbi:adenylate kinase [Aerosakkonema funiforme]|uniref:adenylate kinase n=1 Tax=Aerosakkonema funiforme TaxID=1246630 RepID=UPI0035BA0183
MRIIFLGPNGAGKGTQAAIVAKDFGIHHISTGELLRQERKTKTDRGQKAQSYIDKGALVPDSIVLDIVKEQLTKKEAKPGWILDGFPRNVAQVGSLDKLLRDLNQASCDCVINFDVPDSVLVQRLRKRAIKENRTDDTPEVIRRRIQIFQEETAPLINLYSEWLLLETINGFMSKEAVTSAIKEVLSEVKNSTKS